MLRKAFGVAIGAIMPFVAVAAFLTPRPVTVSMPADRDAVESAIAPEMQSNVVSEDEGATDQFGNPVTDAVARYKFDATGSLYELHSPQTEVPRLRPPKT